MESFRECFCVRIFVGVLYGDVFFRGGMMGKRWRMSREWSDGALGFLCRVSLCVTSFV